MQRAKMTTRHRSAELHERRIQTRAGFPRWKDGGPFLVPAMPQTRNFGPDAAVPYQHCGTRCAVRWRARDALWASLECFLGDGGGADVHADVVFSAERLVAGGDEGHASRSSNNYYMPTHIFPERLGKHSPVILKL